MKDSYGSPAKLQIRKFIDERVQEFANVAEPRHVEAIWLSNNELTDVPRAPSLNITIVEHDRFSLGAKRKAVRSAAGLPGKVNLRYGNLQEYLLHTCSTFEIGNLDFCSHFSPWVYAGVDRFLRQVPRRGLLFLTVARRSRLVCRGLWHGFVSCKYNDIKGFVESKSLAEGITLEDLSTEQGLRDYSGVGGAHMFFYAWRVEKNGSQEISHEKRSKVT